MNFDIGLMIVQIVVGWVARIVELGQSEWPQTAAVVAAFVIGKFRFLFFCSTKVY